MIYILYHLHHHRSFNNMKVGRLFVIHVTYEGVFVTKIDEVDMCKDEIRDISWSKINYSG